MVRIAAKLPHGGFGYFWRMAIVLEKSSATLASFIIILPEDAADLLESRMSQLYAVVEQRCAFFEVILVDDSGSLAYAEIVPALLEKFSYFHYIRLNRSFGDEIASYAGLDQAIGDHMVLALLGQDPMAELPILLETCQREDRIVFGRARNKPRGGLLRKLGQQLFGYYTAQTMNVKLHKDLTRLVGMPRSVVNSLLKVRDPSGYLSVQTGYVGLRTVYHDYSMERPDRWHTHENLGRSVARGINIVAQNSVHPLRFLTWIGAVGALLNMIYFLFVVGVYFFKPDYTPGWVALSAQQAIYFFFICAFFVVISEYMGQIMITVKGRPLYFVADERHSNVLDALRKRKNVVGE